MLVKVVRTFSVSWEEFLKNSLILIQLCFLAECTLFIKVFENWFCSARYYSPSIHVTWSVFRRETWVWKCFPAFHTAGLWVSQALTQITAGHRQRLKTQIQNWYIKNRLKSRCFIIFLGSLHVHSFCIVTFIMFCL